MTIQLTIDEMLEILHDEGSPHFDSLRLAAESVAEACAYRVQKAEPRLVWSGRVAWEPLAFAGTCASFSPRECGPVPACLLNIDVEVQEWEDMAADMLRGDTLFAQN
jgi:hypothetical protein